jgi:hypothetical protein
MFLDRGGLAGQSADIASIINDKTSPSWNPPPPRVPGSTSSHQSKSIADGEFVIAIGHNEHTSSSANLSAKSQPPPPFSTAICPEPVPLAQHDELGQSHRSVALQCPRLDMVGSQWLVAPPPSHEPIAP